MATDYYGLSEYAGETWRNTLAAKPADAVLSPAERARLIKLTGTEDITAEPDRRAWLGLNPTPESVIDFQD